MAGIAAYAVLRRKDVASFTLGCAATIVLTCWAHDMLSVFEIMPNERTFVSRLSYSALLIAIGAGLTWRFARALNQVDSFAGQLVARVREAEERLKASFAREEARARAAALANERTRLMRDLHDGLGGQLISIVALSERGQEGATITDAARAALKDLRLVIDSMDDIGGDLMLALGSWRERAAMQLRPHDIALDWRVATPQGLPLHPELRPWHVIQIVRILDEAVTNAVKHAAARHIAVAIETRDDGQGPYGVISVADDGRGFALGDCEPQARARPRAACATCEIAPRAAAQCSISARIYPARACGCNCRRSFPTATRPGAEKPLPERMVFFTSPRMRGEVKKGRSAHADAIDRAAAIHRRAGTNADAGRSHTGRCHSHGRNRRAGRDHHRSDRPHHATLGHADRLAIDHRLRRARAQRHHRRTRQHHHRQPGAQRSRCFRHLALLLPVRARCNHRVSQPTAASMAKDDAPRHAMKMGVRRASRRADAMNMAWTGHGSPRDGPARPVPAGPITIPRRCLMKISVLAALLLTAAVLPATAQSGPTPQEQMACRSDAGKFCAEHIGKPPQRTRACARTRPSFRTAAARWWSRTAGDVSSFSPCGRRWREASDEGSLSNDS